MLTNLAYESNEFRFNFKILPTDVDEFILKRIVSGKRSSDLSKTFVLICATTQ